MTKLELGYLDDILFDKFKTNSGEIDKFSGLESWTEARSRRLRSQSTSSMRSTVQIKL